MSNLTSLRRPFAQGHTGDRYVSVQFALDFNVDSHDLGEPEKLYAEDASEPERSLLEYDGD